MSSAPGVLDPREYVYQYWYYVVPDNVSHQLGAQNQWLVTKIQVFGGGNAGHFFISGTPAPPIDFAADGCITLEPNGAYRGDMAILGEGAVLIVEFWIQANPQGPIAVTVT
jgi:hypothetical protein